MLKENIESPTQIHEFNMIIVKMGCSTNPVSEKSPTGFFTWTNCQIKCNAYGKKPKSSSLGVLYFIHFLGLLFINFKLIFKSSIFTSDKSYP